MVVDGITTRDLRLNYPEIIEAIYAVRDGITPRFARGKYPDNLTAVERSVSPPSQGGDGSALAGRGGSDALLAKLDQLADRIEKMNITVAVETIEREMRKYAKIQQTKGL
jgi:hypothetical protein